MLDAADQVLDLARSRLGLCQLERPLVPQGRDGRLKPVPRAVPIAIVKSDSSFENMSYAEQPFGLVLGEPAGLLSAGKRTFADPGNLLDPFQRQPRRLGEP